MQLLGTSFIGYSRSTGTQPFAKAINPATGENLEPQYFGATQQEVEKALALADAAFPQYSALSGMERAVFLRAIAEKIEALIEEIVLRTPLESSLAEPRVRGEAGRTTSQLRMFADLIEEGSWVDARIERTQPDRHPLPKPDLRSMLRPLGPVAVFCASNFPLAFSVAGGDSASAWASGCPVIVIAHESHPGVAEIVATAVAEAAQETGMPEGVFSLLYGGGRTVGQAVVRHPVIQAVGFTGSRAAGLALSAIANARPQPIPVYAEMSAVNPLVIMPGALAKGEEALAEAYFGSLTLGVGQFCTNPGLVFLPEGKGDAFLKRLGELIEDSSPGTMLNPSICQSYADATAALESIAGVEVLARASVAPGFGQAAPVVFTATTHDFVRNSALHGEIFGPASLIVRGPLEGIRDALAVLEGQLTASFFGTEDELTTHEDLVGLLRKCSGRFLYNGFPTGVEVCTSMVHGGPFPSTTDGRSTSVGTMAITRFCRPCAWQGFPQSALPAELRDGNPLGIRRMEDGTSV